MASGAKRQLCAVLVLRRRGTRMRQSGTVELVIRVLTDGHEMSAQIKNVQKKFFPKKFQKCKK